ncbi:MAG: HAD family hydrolase [Clostridia bacterium]|nr:HAD family hydrolase [Clostridia bacterium]
MQEQKIRAVIFDLDDTLYAEKEYVKSGYDAVGAASDIPALAEKLWVAFEKGLPAIDTVLEKAGKLSEKDRLLTVYRSHKPTLSLYKGAETLLKRLKAEGIQVGIITDGRPEGQRNKLEALGLYDLADEIIVTDELGGVRFRKPNDIAFRIMQCRMNVPFANMVYVGDNVHKDFNAPRTLGMQSVHFVNPEGLYFNGVQENTKSANSFAELEAILLKG